MDSLTPSPELYGLPGTMDDYQGMPYLWMGRSGLRASAVGLGTWKFGFPETGDGSRVDEVTALKIMDRAVDLGVTFWDTAARYNNSSGNSERLIGRWLQANPDMRRTVVVATKLFGGMDGRTPNHCRLSRSNILASVYASLARMQLDYVDLLYFHAFETRTPLEESLSAVEDLVRRDLIRYFGVSNVTVDRLREHQALEQRMSVRSRVVAVQNGYNILQGEFHEDQKGVLGFCAREGISYVPYSPLARGMLTDRYLNPTQARPGDRLVDEGRLLRYATDDALAKVRALHGLADKWGMAVSQLALAYTLTLRGMGPVIPSASSVVQLESNAQAGKLTLTDHQKRSVAAILKSVGTDKGEFT